ncbi:MAG: peptide deformylase [Verrucomicrobia bacterium]|nr:peptide deformylase [Verrucomicrobiota bacterium]
MSFLEASLEIVTMESAQAEVLKTKAELMQPDELELAREISRQLYLALEPFFPAAGIAAPQIGIGKAVFIFSWNRDPKNFEVVINPSFIPVGEEKVEEWESCFSAILKTGVRHSAKIARYEKIQVKYMNQEGVMIEKILEGFAAKVFQHEYDHLQGCVNITRPDAEVKSFNTDAEYKTFMIEVKKQDAKRYTSS